MEIVNVASSSRIVDVGNPLAISFRITGDEGAVAFEFPFSNESLIENKIQFVKEDV